MSWLEDHAILHRAVMDGKRHALAVVQRWIVESLNLCGGTADRRNVGANLRTKVGESLAAVLNALLQTGLHVMQLLDRGFVRVFLILPVRILLGNGKSIGTREEIIDRV